VTSPGVVHLSADERRAQGKAARKQTPRESHGDWVAATNRPDAVALLEAQDADREPDLVPVRHGRMMVSPFTFYRGTAKIMATDLAETPTACLEVQLCGDAHLSNFGGFASPERLLLFDVNDFDETLPGPFEYDVKRLAASFTVCARHLGYSSANACTVTMESMLAYRQAMAQFAEMGLMATLYARMDSDDLLANIRTSGLGGKQAEKRLTLSAEKTLRTARTHDSLQALAKLCEVVDGRYRIISQPPLVVPLRDQHVGACAPIRSGSSCTTSCAPTARLCRTIGGSCWSGSSSSTPHGRWSASAASALAALSRCSAAAMRETRYSFRSSRRAHPCLRTASRPLRADPSARGRVRTIGKG
jgi:hypothetical protein